MTNDPNFTASISLNKQPCKTRPTLIDLNLDENNQKLHCYPFRCNLDIMEVPILSIIYPIEYVNL